MMIGTVLVARSRLQTSRPSIFGSMMSRTTRSTSLVSKPPQCLLAVARLDDAVPVPLERIREEFLDRVLVVDEQNGGGFRHRRCWLDRGSSPSRRTIAPVVAASDSRGRRGQRAPQNVRAPRRRTSRPARFARPADQRPARARVDAAPARAAAAARADDRPARPVSRVCAAAVVRRAVGDLARDRALARPSRSRARIGGRRRRRDLVQGEARPLRARGRRRRLGRDDPRAGPGPAAQSRHRHPRRDARCDPHPRASRRHRGRARRQRQRHRHGRPDRARAGLRAAWNRGRATDADAHAHLSLLRRRRVRRLRGRALRAQRRPSGTGSRLSSRSTGWRGQPRRGSSWRASSRALRPRL